MKRGYDTALSGRVGALRRQVSSMLGLAVLLLNVWAGVAVAARSTNADPVLAAFAEGRIVICTGSGMLVVDENGQPVASSTPGSSNGSDIHCQFCLPLMQGVAPPASFPVAISDTQVYSVVDRLPTTETIPARTFLSSLSARAPPQA